MFDFLQICLRKAKPVCKIPHMFILADVWLLPNMFGKNQTRWYIYTWVLFSTHVWILTHRYGKRHTCVQKATQLYVCKCLAFSTHVWEKPLTCLFPPELWVGCWQPMLTTTSPVNLVSAAPVNPGVRPTSQSTTISHIIILILFPTKSPHIFKRYTILAIIIT